jgi:hypothetical protein
MNTDYGVTRTYRLQRNTAERLNELAATLNIFPSALVDALLARALDEIDDGRIIIHTRPARYELDRIEPT